MVSLGAVLTRQPDEEEDHCRDEHQDQPCSVKELREATTRATTSDTAAPRPLIRSPVFQPGSFSRKWCLAIPDCESVNDVKTPIAYSGIRRSTLAPVTTSRPIAATARKMIPFENTSRCPR